MAHASCLQILPCSGTADHRAKATSSLAHWVSLTFRHPPDTLASPVGRGCGDGEEQQARYGGPHAIKALAERGQSNRAIARLLGVHENAVRYHRRRLAAGAVDGRSRQRHLAERFAPAIEHWLEHLDTDGRLNLAALHDWLVAEHAYPGTLRSLQRYFRAHYPRPHLRARRRVETPPGAQAQADWGEFPRVLIDGRQQRMSLFALKLSFSRYPAFIWSTREDQLAWHRVHNEAFC